MQQTNINASKALNDFVNRLFEEKGYRDLDKETEDQMKADLLESVQDRINAAMLANIPAEKMEFFEKLLEQGDSEEVQSFCQRNITDLDIVVARELLNFRNTYLNI